MACWLAAHEAGRVASVKPVRNATDLVRLFHETARKKQHSDKQACPNSFQKDIYYNSYLIKCYELNRMTRLDSLELSQTITTDNFHAKLGSEGEYRGEGIVNIATINCHLTEQLAAFV
jgi:hypothetical protein